MIEYPTDPEFIAAMTDAELLAAYQRTNGEPGDAEVEALIVEIRKRELDI